MNEGEIISATKDKIRIPKRLCNVLYILKILMKFLHKTSCNSYNWLIILVTMATPISSHVKGKNSIFTACDEDMIF